MRLLKTDRFSQDQPELQFESEGLESDSSLPYAIFSHTWGFDEVLFADVKNGTFASRVGFNKIQSVLRHAREDGFRLIWVDNICIDKSSSAELSEAINSMFVWYQGASKCYAYLADVPATPTPESGYFGQSRWWTRGWTLQELLAPRDVEFFSKDWSSLGTKLSLAEKICDITGIDTAYLDGSLTLEAASVAKRMSWASERQTRREEDIAYCLMGLFAVNMPMLYGEGKRAFIRLQTEIMSHTDDQSLFAWVEDIEDKNDHDIDDYEQCHGLLADHPRHFRRSRSSFSYSDWEGRKPYSMTNRGLSIELHLSRTHSAEIFAAALQCPPHGEKDGFLVIYLRKLTGSVDQYGRVACHKMSSTSQRGRRTMVFVPQSYTKRTESIIYPHHFFMLGTNAPSKSNLSGYRLVQTVPEQPLSPPERSYFPKPSSQPPNWASEGIPIVYKFIKQPAKLAIAAILRNYSSEVGMRPDIALLLGSLTIDTPAFDICEIPGGRLEDTPLISPKAPLSPSFSTLTDNYKPHKMGTVMWLSSWKFTVTAEEKVEAGQKIYVVDFYAAKADIEESSDLHRGYWRGIGLRKAVAE